MVRCGYSPTDFYKPSREDTKEDIEKLRIIVENQLRAFRPIVILGVTDIVLWILKCDEGFNKRVEIEKLISPITDHRFEQMLLITQHITDYSDINLSTTDHPSCVDQFHNHDHHIATMECIVAYALLIRLYEYGPRIRRHRCFPPAQIAHRKKAYEMLLILRNESVKPMEAQKNMISRFFRRGIIPQCWYDVIVSVKEAAINHAKSTLYGDEEVIGALFRGGAKFWLPEEPSTAFHNHDHHIATMECIVAYALLIRLYEYGPRIQFRSCWYDVIVSVKEAAINHAKSTLYGDDEVIGALFRGGAKFWLPEEPSTAYCSILLAKYF
ncbi:hypothetical protein Scep_008917 [Stephania cephalantha]|uniref:Uncharacterized protein n=1 Tax=Stephania cephalantha TaxID=152367 RepID=A0AAP0JS38_9MAGN